MKVTVLVGGVGGARFLQGVREVFGRTPFPAVDAPADGEPVAAADLVGRFEPGRLPREPTVLAG